MNDKDEVVAMFKHYHATKHSAWYAVNKTAALLSMDVETVQKIVEEAQWAAEDEVTDPRQNPCPECPEGEIVFTKAHPMLLGDYACSAGCGWSA